METRDSERRSPQGDPARGFEEPYSSPMPLESAAVGAMPQIAGRRFRVKDSTLKWLLIAPAAVLLFVLMIYPLSYSFWLSLHRWDIITPGQFIGLGNYERILTDERMWNSVRVTFTFAIPAFILEFVLGFALALLVNQEIKGKGVFRVLMIVPMMLTPVVVAINFRLMFNYDFGIVNWFFGLFGVEKIGWIAHPIWAMVVLIAVEVWRETPFVMLVLAAGLAALPTEPLEAAEVDGANWWQKLWHVTIPMLMPLFLVVALFRSYNLIRTYDLVFGLTGGGPGKATETLSYHILERMAYGFQMGYSSAICYVLFFISFIISLVFIRAMGLKGQVD